MFEDDMTIHFLVMCISGPETELRVYDVYNLNLLIV